MTKIIINVGRQIGSGGHIIAEKLAEDFGCKCYDRELLNLAAKESGFSEKFFEQNDEQKGFFKSLFHTHLPFLSDNNFYHNDFSQEGLYKFQSDAIRKAADEGNCVFVGRTADYVLRDYKNVINIFITANIDDRISYDVYSLELVIAVAFRIDSIESRAFRDFIMQAIIKKQTNRPKLVCLWSKNIMV